MEDGDRFTVHVIAQGIPLFATHDMHTRMYLSSNIFFHFDGE